METVDLDTLKLYTRTHTCIHTQVMHKPVLFFKYNTAHFRVLCETLRPTWFHHHTHKHFPLLTHSICEILPKQVIQYFPVTNRYSHLTRHFPVLWGGNLQSSPEHGRWEHTFYTQKMCHFPLIQQYLHFEWHFVSSQLLPVRLFQGLKRTLLFAILKNIVHSHFASLFLWKKRKAPYCFRNVFFMSSTGFIKMSSALLLTAAAKSWLYNFCLLLLYNALSLWLLS